MSESYIHPTQEAGAALFARNLEGPVVMLNLLRFRETADYSESPELAPENQISGEEAYKKYIEHTLPFLEGAGSEVIFMGEGGSYLIGPSNERWDRVLLVRHASLSAFLKFARNEGYLKGAGHRTAALADSRLLPIIES